MRTKKVFKNGRWAIFAFAINFFINLLIRKKFLATLDNNVFGYEATIGSLFTFLTISESGIGTAITYRLYDSLAHKDEYRTGKLMRMYEYSYRTIGIILLVLSIFAYFILPVFFTSDVDWKAIRFVYVILVADMVCRYAISTSIMLFIAVQKAYVCVTVDIITTFVGAGLRILVLVFRPDYRLYLLITIIMTIISNTIIKILCYHEYPYVKGVEFDFEDFKSEKLLKDVKDCFIQKICYSIYGGIDNLLTSKFLGINVVTLVSNYRNIEGNVTTVTEKIVSGLQSGIGDAVYTEDKEYLNKIFTRLDFVNFCYTLIVTCCLAYVFQPFIDFWLCVKYQLPYVFVIALAFRIYVAYNQRTATMFRGAVGGFDKDRKYIVLAAIINIIISLILIKPLGIAGLEIGTMISAAVIWLGRAMIVFTHILESHMAKQYVINQIKYIMTLLLSMSLLQVLIWILPSVDNFIFRIIISVSVPALIILVLYGRSDEFRFLLRKLNLKGELNED